MRVAELIEEAESIIEELSDFETIGSLFSDNKDERSLAKLRRSISRLLWKLKAARVKEVLFPREKYFNERNVGKLVRVRPCSDEYEGKTYLGFHLGHAKTSFFMEHTNDGNIQLELSGGNPAMYVPELKKVIYGFESWWSEIESEEDLKVITDETIEKTWYVKLAREAFQEERE